MLSFMTRKVQMIPEAEALPGRATPLATAETHYLSGIPLKSPVPEGMAEAILAMGCFWGVERILWQVPGVWLSMVGYAGGFTPNPTYEEVCSGRTGHTEVVRVLFDPARLAYDDLLRVFWENHDPTQGMRQGNDIGTQYRSAIYTYGPDQQAAALAGRDDMTPRFQAAGFPAPTTEIRPAPVFYYAEGYHQQYLAKNPAGYCGIGGTGVTCPAP
ncbi:MAG: peptide-methionine (S)-S-oxide reductase MsrA [Qingshengfaniella sp.]